LCNSQSTEEKSNQSENVKLHPQMQCCSPGTIIVVVPIAHSSDKEHIKRCRDRRRSRICIVTTTGAKIGVAIARTRDHDDHAEWVFHQSTPALKRCRFSVPSANVKLGFNAAVPQKQFRTRGNVYIVHGSCSLHDFHVHHRGIPFPNHRDAAHAICEQASTDIHPNLGVTVSS
jgi:hypothetical protein